MTTEHKGKLIYVTNFRLKCPEIHVTGFFSEVARQRPATVFKKYSIKGVSRVVFQIFQKRYSLGNP